MKSNNLLFRRQFLVSEKSCDLFPHWNHAGFDNYHIYSHPDLEIALDTSEQADFKFALLGYMIDPHNPNKTNEDLLCELSNNVRTTEDLAEYLIHLSGRFVLLFSNHEDLFVYHDACGLRSVFYTRFKGNIYFGSQPTILQHVVPFKKGERFENYLSSDYSQNFGQDWIPAGTSLFEQVHQLVPNHYLRLSELGQVRYWPTKPIENSDLEEAVSNVSGLLKNSLLAAHKRQKLALSLTAGWDSRILLSASKEFSNDVFYYTQFHFGMTRKTNDIRIPKKLTNHLNLNYHAIDCRKGVPDYFDEIYKRNTSFTRLEGMDSWIKRVSGLINSYPKDRLRVSGNCSEIARCSYYRSGTHNNIDDADQILSLIPGWKSLGFIREAIFNWFTDAKLVSEKNNIDILDLFYWEQKMGSWQAQHQLEWDIIHESFTPFNNREIIEWMLGVDAKLRIRPECLFFEKVIKNLWPDVMIVAINPPPTKFTAFKKSLIQNIKNKTSNFWLYKASRNVYRKLQKKGII